MRIIFTGGGTGGHIFPIIAIVREIRKIRPDFQFYYIGPKDQFGKILFSREKIRVKTILAGKIRRYWGGVAFFQNLLDILIKIPVGFLQSFFYVFFLFPDLIFSKGGYGSLTTVFWGWIFQTPIILHESDIIPGLSNRLAGKFALEIFISFSVQETKHFSFKKMISVGNPVRKEILGGEVQESRKFFGLSGEKPVVLVLGGSQGAQRINDTVLNVLPQLLSNFELIHQTGSRNFEEIKLGAEAMLSGSSHQYIGGKGALERHYHPFPFLNENELKAAFKACDLVVSRAGSGSIFEIAAAGKPSLLIPLPESAQGHQLKNAYAYQNVGACIVIEEENLTPHFFLEKMKHLFSQPFRLEELSGAAKIFSRPRAAEIIARYIIDYLIS